MNEEQSLRRHFSTKTVLLLVIVAILAGITIVQQVQITNLRPIASQELRTEQSWLNFEMNLLPSESASQSGAAWGANGENVSLVIVSLDMNNSSCFSFHGDCNGYNYYFNLENVCLNSSYFGTCNFSGFSIFWYDVSANGIAFTTLLENVSIPQGQAVTVHGNWPNRAFSYIAVNDLIFLEVSTSGGWAVAPASISS